MTDKFRALRVAQLERQARAAEADMMATAARMVTFRAIGMHASANQLERRVERLGVFAGFCYDQAAALAACCV